MSNERRYDDANNIKDDILHWTVPEKGYPLDGESSSRAFLSPSFRSQSYMPGSWSDSDNPRDLDLSSIPSYGLNSGIIATVQGSGGLGKRPTFAMRVQTNTPASELIECGARAASEHNVNIMLDVVASKSDRDEYWLGQQDCMEQLLAKLRKDRDNINEIARESLQQHYLNSPSDSQPSIDVTPPTFSTTSVRAYSSSLDPSRLFEWTGDIIMFCFTLMFFVGIPLLFWLRGDFMQKSFTALLDLLGGLL